MSKKKVNKNYYNSITKEDIKKYLSNSTNSLKRTNKTSNVNKQSIDVLQVAGILRFWQEAPTVLDDLVDTLEIYAISDIDTAAFSIGKDKPFHVVGFKVIVTAKQGASLLKLLGKWLEEHEHMVLLQDMDITSGTASKKEE